MKRTLLALSLLFAAPTFAATQYPVMGGFQTNANFNNLDQSLGTAYIEEFEGQVTFPQLEFLDILTFIKDESGQIHLATKSIHGLQTTQDFKLQCPVSPNLTPLTYAQLSGCTLSYQLSGLAIGTLAGIAQAEGEVQVSFDADSFNIQFQGVQSFSRKPVTIQGQFQVLTP